MSVRMMWPFFCGSESFYRQYRLATRPAIRERRISVGLGCEDVRIQKLVAEFSVRIERFRQFDELAHLAVVRAQLLRRHREEFSPVRPRAERNNFLLDLRQQSAHLGPLGLPRE